MNAEFKLCPICAEEFIEEHECSGKLSINDVLHLAAAYADAPEHAEFRDMREEHLARRKLWYHTRKKI